MQVPRPATRDPHVQRFDDSVVLAGVNEIEELTTGLSSKIRQRITILERAAVRLP